MHLSNLNAPVLNVLNGTHQLLVYADNDNTRILAGSVHTINKNVEVSLVAGKETGLEVNANKSKYMIMAGRSYNIRSDN